MAVINKKFITNKKIKEVYKDVTNWCSFADIQVIDSDVSDAKFNLKCKKAYPIKSLRFNVKTAVGALIIGSILAFFSSLSKSESSSFASWFLTFFPLGLYLLSCLLNIKEKTVVFEFTGISETSDQSDIHVKISEDWDEAKSELNQLISKLI